jgi:hypothetical protein
MPLFSSFSAKIRAKPAYVERLISGFGCPFQESHIKLMRLANSMFSDAAEKHLSVV